VVYRECCINKPDWFIVLNCFQLFFGDVLYFTFNGNCLSVNLNIFQTVLVSTMYECIILQNVSSGFIENSFLAFSILF